MANSLSIAINSLHHVMEQQNEVARADHNAIHQNLRDLGFRLENNLGDKIQEVTESIGKLCKATVEGISRVRQEIQEAQQKSQT